MQCADGVILHASVKEIRACRTCMIAHLGCLVGANVWKLTEWPLVDQFALDYLLKDLMQEVLERDREKQRT